MEQTENHKGVFMWRLQPALSLAIMVDVQAKLFPYIDGAEALQLRLETLFKGLKILELPVLITEQYPKGLGETLPELRQLFPDAACYEKMSFSCFGAPEFNRELLQSGKNTVILAGIESHVCVQQTALDLLSLGYRVVVVEDGVGSRKASDRETALARLRGAGVIPVSCESLLLELCQTAGTPRFKAISKLIK